MRALKVLNSLETGDAKARACASTASMLPSFRERDTHDDLDFSILLFRLE